MPRTSMLRKLGADAIKEQQQINLKFSSDEVVAVIPEDRAQRMLAGVSYYQRVQMQFMFCLSLLCIRMH